jgi:hypothetical protein
MCEFHASKLPDNANFIAVWGKMSMAPVMLRSEIRLCFGSADAGWMSMKTLLRNMATGLYFQGPDRWTGNAAEARDFKAIDRAIEFIRTWKLDGVELAFAFRGTNKVTSMPVERIVEI